MIRHTEKYWVSLIPFLPLILLVFSVFDCRICSFFFEKLNSVCWQLVSSRPLSGKGPTADGPSSVQPTTPSFHLHCQASFFFLTSELILHISSSEVFHSSGFLLAATLNTRTIFLTTSDAQSLLSADSGAHISRTTYLTEICSFIFISICTKSIQRSSQKVLQSNWAFESRSLAYIS